MAVLHDKQKLTDWVHSVKMPPSPELESDELKTIYREGVAYLELCLNGMLKELDKVG